ncbi:alpha/beta hydrolase [Aquimarina sp. I32.4]|uniref:alpha/beta hydrolase n=1 Tax=Aquimarina sp. I32.4 TaxID=2053903 RepID=UPI000CDEAABC|nr:alpha/beta fold hydrolase [Aquimarina sp. I32.4]
MNKNGKWVFCKRAFILLVISGVLFLHFYIPRFITEIKNPLIETIKTKHIIASTSFDTNKLKGKYIHFKSFDKTAFTSYLTYSNLDTVRGTIILLHGIRSNKESFVKLSKKLSLAGYNSIALDSRAHGQSGGTHCTFGVKEKKDISVLINLLNQQENITENIGIWGQSLGGAIALQSLGNDKRITFGVIESTFSDFKTITNDYFKYHVGFNIKPLTNYLIYRAGKIAGFDPDDARPITYCKKIEQPVLIVHGNKDKRINITYAKNNFANIPSTKKEFIEIKNANHLTVWKTGGDAYFNTTLEFIEESILRNQSQ